MRGNRKCGTCQWFEPLPDIYKSDGCKLPICECRTADKKFGIALCQNYVPKRFLDTSNSRGYVEGMVDGFCRWQPPPHFQHVLWGSTGNCQRNSDTSWCSCWEPVKAVSFVGLSSDARIATSAQAAIAFDAE